MTNGQSVPKDIDEYIAGFPKDVQEALQKIRKTIKTEVPLAQEAIKYGMPTFTLDGNLLSFAAYQKHIALYPAPEGDAQFNAELASYETEKSTVRFALDKPIPFELVKRIVKFRLQDHLARAAARKKKKLRRKYHENRTASTKNDR